MIGSASFEKILREYDEKRLKAEQSAHERKSSIEASVPGLHELSSEIIKLSVSRVTKNPGLSAEEKAKWNAGCKEHIKQLMEQKSRLLKEYGYGLKDLEPCYECDFCRDTGFVNDRMCSCLKSRITDVLYDQSNIKEMLDRENFSHYDFSTFSDKKTGGDAESALTSAVRAKETAMIFVKNFEHCESNLLITGKTGLGKTFLANCIVKDILDRGHSVIYLTAIRFFDLLSKAAFEKSSGSSELIVKSIYGCELLVIDDLGTELNNSFVSSALFNCINERLIKKKHTIISTNLSISNIKDLYSERVASRITKNYTAIRLCGEDIRIKKKLEV